MQIRIDKYLAHMGVGTRSEVKNQIRKKQVQVNGICPSGPEQKVTIGIDQVMVSGSIISYVTFEYYLFYKPAGCVSATTDASHTTVLDYITSKNRKDLFPVGRLDLDTEGLLLLTNDGALAHELLSPQKHVSKTYYAKIDGCVTLEDIKIFADGIDIGEEKITRPGILRILSSGLKSEIELTITEGKYHQVKRMFQAIGKPVLYLKRISMGPLQLDTNMNPGEYRQLTSKELRALGKK
ncbi:MAG: pseudouridine synthase [Lachnospiraceae bacterium]